MWEEERTPAWAVLLFIALFVGVMVATAYIWAYLGGFLADESHCSQHHGSFRRCIRCRPGADLSATFEQFEKR